MNAPANIKTFDPAGARADFEILSREVYGKPLVYLDNAASAQKPRQVLDAMRDFAAGEYANVHRGVHFLSAASTERYESARETVRKFLNAAHGDEIVFTKGGTEAMNLVSYSYLAPRIQPGDEIVLSVMEHHSNIVPWHSCASATARCCAGSISATTARWMRTRSTPPSAPRPSSSR